MITARIPTTTTNRIPYTRGMITDGDSVESKINMIAVEHYVAMDILVNMHSLSLVKLMFFLIGRSPML